MEHGTKVNVRNGRACDLKSGVSKIEIIQKNGACNSLKIISYCCGVVKLKYFHSHTYSIYLPIHKWNRLIQLHACHACNVPSQT